MSQKTNKLSRGTTKQLTKIGVLAGAAGVLMLLEFPLWFAPHFYELDFSEVAVLLGGFAIGPVASIAIEFVKILLNLALNGTITGGVGEAANFIIGCSFVFPAAVIYHKNKTFKSAVIGLIVGTILMAIVGAIANYYVLIPLYAKVYGAPLQVFIDAGNVLNKAVVDLKTLILFAVVPFNLFKGIVVSTITVLLYKKLSPILHK